MAKFQTSQTEKESGMEYDLIESDTIAGLVEKVNKAIENGWHPQGGISVAFWLVDGLSYCQAMTRMVPPVNQDQLPLFESKNA